MGVVTPPTVPGILGRVEESFAAVTFAIVSFHLSIFLSCLSDISDTVYMCNAQMWLLFGLYLFPSVLYFPIEYSMLVVNICYTIPMHWSYILFLCFKCSFLPEFVLLPLGADSEGLGGCEPTRHPQRYLVGSVCHCHFVCGSSQLCTFRQHVSLPCIINMNRILFVLSDK